MTRQTRTLILLGAIGLGAVVALGSMAQRYRLLLEGREPTAGAARPAGGPSAPPGGTAAVEERDLREAERLVLAFVVVRQDLRRVLDGRPPGAADDDAAGLEEDLRRELERSLRRNGLDRPRFRSLETMFRAWSETGAPLPAAFAEAFARHGDPVRRLELDGYDPLDL